MVVNIKALFQHLMKDPDIVPPEGESKKDVAIALATQRAKQAFNNEKALNMAIQDRSISKLLAFLKADDDDAESVSEAEELKPEINRAEFNTHDRNFRKFQAKVSNAKKQGKEPKWDTKQQVEATAARSEGRTAKKLDDGDEISVKGQKDQDDWEAAYDYLGDIAGYKQIANFDDKIERALSGEDTEEEQEAGAIDTEAEEAGEAGKAREDKADTSGVSERPGQRSGETDSEYDFRMTLRSPEAKKRDLLRRLKALGETEDSRNEVKEAVESHMSPGDIEEKDVEEKRATGHPYHPSKFGDSVKQQQGFGRVFDAAGKSMEFLEDAHDWYTRAAGEKGEEDGDGLPGMGKSANHHLGGTRMGISESLVDPDKALTMIREYKEALEDKANEAKRVEGDPIDAPIPASERESDIDKLKAWGKVSGGETELDKYKEDMDGLRNKLLGAYGKPNEGDHGQLRTARNKSRNNKPEAAEALDKVRDAWGATGLDADRKSGKIDDSQYYEGLDKFLREHKPTHDAAYRDNRQHLGGTTGTIPTLPTDKPELPSEDAQSDLMAFLEEQNPTGGEVEAKVKEVSEKVTRGKGTAKKKANKVEALSAYAAEAVNQTNENKDESDKIEYTPPTKDEIANKIATDAVVDVRENEESPESLASAENLVGEETLGDIAEAHGLPESRTPMSRNARKHLRENGIDPDGEGLGHIRTKKHAEDHVDRHKAETAELDDIVSEAATPSLDDFSEGHMQRWLDRVVGEKDGYRGPERDRVEAGLRRQLEEEPSLLEGGTEWSTIRQRAEANNYMPEIEEADVAEEPAAEEPKSSVERLSEYTSETPDAETPDVFEEDVRGRDLGARDNFNGKDVTLEHQTTDEETGIRHELWTNEDGEGVVRQIDESGAIIESADGGLNAIHDRYNKNLVTNELDPYTPTDTPELTEEAAEVAEEPVKETPPKKEPRKRASRAKKGTPVEQLTDHVKESEEDAGAADAKREEELKSKREDLAMLQGNLDDKNPDGSVKYLTEHGIKDTQEDIDQLTQEIANLSGEEPPKTTEPKSTLKPGVRVSTEREVYEEPASDQVDEKVDEKVTPDEGTPPPDDPPKTPEASDDEEDKRVPLAPVQPASARELEELARYQTPTPKPKEAVPGVDQGKLDLPDAEDTPSERREVTVTEEDIDEYWDGENEKVKNSQASLDEQQAIHDKHKEAEDAAKTKYEELDETRHQPGVTEAENFSLLDKMKEAEDEGKAAQDGQRDAQGEISRHQKIIDDTKAEIERVGKTPTPPEEVTPEETSEETSTTEPQPESTERTTEAPPDAPTDEGTGEDVGEPVGDEAPTPRAQRRVTERQSKMPLGRLGRQASIRRTGGADTESLIDEEGQARPEPSTEETVTATTGEGAGIDRLTREVTPLERERREAGRGPRTLREGRQPSFEDYEGSPQQAEAEERGARAGAARENVSMKRNELKTKFGMEDRFVDNLSDEDVHQKHAGLEARNNDGKASEQMKRGFSKEDVLKAMAKADGREGDEDHLNTLRDRYQFHSPEDVKKEHMEQIKRRAESAHSMKQDAAIADATNMQELPDDVDSYHAENRIREIMKKLDAHKQSHEKDGKPLLDMNAVKNLKEMTDDAVNKGDLSGEDMERLHAELNDMGHKFWDDDHQSQLDGEHETARLAHQEHMEHVSGPGGHEARVEAFDHSKAHELHHYERDADGNRGERTGSTYNRKDADGKRERVEEPNSKDSLNSAVEHLEAPKHPPKVPGLDDEEKIAQKEHFDLIKKGGLRSDDETATMKQLEQDNPFLHDPQYKAQVLGGNRHQLGGEFGEAVMTNMNLSPDQQEEAQLAACQAPPGAMPPPSNDLKPKAWNPATHRWCDKEYLEGLQGGIGEGEGMLMPNGLHHGTENAHLDQDAAGNVQGAIVTKDGVFKHHPPAKLGQTPTGPMGASDLAGHALSEAAHAADITGHGDKISKDIVASTGHGHSATHGSKGVASKPPPPGPTALRNRKNKEREQRANASTGIQRQMSRRDTEGSPLKRFLSGTMAAAKEGAIEVGGELPGYLGGGQVKGTEAWQKHQIRQATKTVQTKERAATKFRRLMDEVQQESS